MVSSPQVWAGEEGRFPRASVLPRRQVRLPAPRPQPSVSPLPLCQMTRRPQNPSRTGMEDGLILINPFSRRGT